MVQKNNESQVRRSTRLRIKKKEASMPKPISALKKKAKSGVNRPRNIEIPKSRVEISLNVEPIISLDDHHISVLQCDAKEYFPSMSVNVEAGFERVFCLKDDQRNQSWATSHRRPLDVALDGLSTSIMREVMSVLRPETSLSHKSMDHISFLTHDSYAKPFLCALNGCDESTTARLMNSSEKVKTPNKGIAYDNMLENVRHPVFLNVIDAGYIARELRNMNPSQLGREMAEYVTQLAASVQRIQNASNVADKDKLLWISVVRLFFISTMVTLGLGHYSLLGEFISGNALNTTLSLVLGEHTRSDNCIDLWLLKAVYERLAAQGDPFGPFSWVRVFDENADLIFNKVVGDPSYSNGFGAVQNT